MTVRNDTFLTELHRHVLEAGYKDESEVCHFCVLRKYLSEIVVIVFQC